MLSTIVCEGVTSHSAVLDVWESILLQLKQIVPCKEEAIHENNSSLERKRKQTSDDTGIIPIKKRKLGNGNPVVVQCLLNLLNNVLMEIDFLDPQHQLSARKRQDHLLQELHELMSDLGVYTIDSKSELSSQYLRLITILGQCQIILYKYRVQDNPTSITDMQVLFEKWEIPLSNPSFITSYYWRKWLCFKLEWIAWQLNENSLSQEYRESVNKSFNEIFSSLLKFVANAKTPDVASVWSGIPENISSAEVLDVATMSLLKSVLHIGLPLSDASSHASLSNIIIKYQEGTKQDDALTSKSILCDFLHSSSFTESKKLHSSLLKSCIEHVLRVFNESGVRKGAVRNVLHFAKSCVTSTEDVNCLAVSKNVGILFDKDLDKPKKLQKTIFHVVDVVHHLPLNNLPINEKCCALLLLACAMISSETNIDVFQKSIMMSDIIIGSKKSKQFLLILPLQKILPYLASRYKLLSSDIKICVRRMLTYLVKLELYESDLKEDTYIRLACDKTGMSFDYSSLMPLHLLLEHISTVILRHRKSSLSEYVFSFNHDVITDVASNVVTTHYFSNKKHLKGIAKPSVAVLLDSKMEERLEKCAVVLEKLLSVASNLLKDPSFSSQSSSIYELLKLTLIACYTLDIYHKTDFNNSHIHRLATQIDMESRISKALDVNDCNDYNIATSKVQLILLVTELKVLLSTTFTDAAHISKILCLSGSPQQILGSLIDNYASTVVKRHFLIKALLDRTIVINLTSLSSHNQYQELFELKMSELRDSDIIDVMMTKLCFARLIASCYDVKSRKFCNINSGNYNMAAESTVEDNSEKEIHFNQIKFLRNALDGAIAVVDKVTSSDIDQSQIKLLIFVFQTISDILKLGSSIVKSRQASASIPELRTFDLHHVTVHHRASFFDFFCALYEVVNSVIVHHKDATVGALPLIISSCRKMLNVTMIIGRQSQNDVTTDVDSWVDVALSCSHYLQRMSHFIASNYASYFKRCVIHLLADYAIGLSTDVLYPSVKDSLNTAMYHLVTLCDENDVSLLKATLPPGVREIFRSFYVDYLNYFKYTGHV